MQQQKTIYEAFLSDIVQGTKTITKEDADAVFSYFKNNPLFRWNNANNDCEDRAHAICILLKAWRIPNYKAWVFGGAYLNKSGGFLINYWNYHVAAALPVLENNETSFYVIDPASCSAPEHISTWAERVTHLACSYYVIKQSDYYIFPTGKLLPDNWNKANRQNFKWTIQGLAGINGVSKAGQAALVFNKKRIEKTEKMFEQLKHNKPAELRSINER